MTLSFFLSLLTSLVISLSISYQTCKQNTHTHTCISTLCVQNGGAIFVTDNAHVELSTVTFTSNSASNYGGAIYSDSSQIHLIDVTFNDNTATVRKVPLFDLFFCFLLIVLYFSMVLFSILVCISEFFRSN